MYDVLCYRYVGGDVMGVIVLGIFGFILWQICKSGEAAKVGSKKSKEDKKAEELFFGASDHDDFGFM